MLDTLLEKDRRLRISHRAIADRATPADRDLIAAVDGYIDDFCRLRGLSAEAFLQAHAGFVARYVNDMKRFRETGRYPLDLEPQLPPPPRAAYDAALLLSVLVSDHRFAIFRELLDVPGPLGDTAVVGAGPGLELRLLAGRAASMDVFDLTIDEATVLCHPHARFHRTYFTAASGRYDTILAIELLEHVRDPYALLGECFEALRDRGRVVATTATNIPQFDHEYNFTDEAEFEARARAIGFGVEHRRALVHDATFLNIGARNDFYVLRKPTA